jgi:hypothetical protein
VLKEEKRKRTLLLPNEEIVICADLDLPKQEKGVA